MSYLTKIALITGINGQDGKYLSELLMKKGYVVHGIKKSSSQSDVKKETDIHLHYSDLTDYSELIKIIQVVQPDEIYNLAAQSNVKVSFEKPEYTTLINALTPLRILEIIRMLGLKRKTRFFQASTGEFFGNSQEIPQKESTSFYPKSPYAISKIYAYWICINYREAYDIFACNGILFNHESPIRPDNFVTRKITKAASQIKKGLQDRLYLGNLDAKRDWGFAGDYVEAMWLMLQQDKPSDYIVATGEAHTVREFVEFAFQEVDIEIEWEGEGLNEVGKDSSNGKTLVEVNSAFYRPVEANLLVGDPTKAREILGWKPTVNFEELVRMMTRNDMNIF